MTDEELAAIEARVWSPTCSQCGAVDPPTEDAESIDGRAFKRHTGCPRPDDLYASEVDTHSMTRAQQRSILAHVRYLRAELADAETLVAKQGALLVATADALKGPPPPRTQHSAHDLPEVAARLRADLAAAQPVLALDAIRRGRAVLVCPDCGASWASDAPTCPGCGRRDDAPDRDPCARCGKPDAGHDCEAPRAQGDGTDGA